MLSNYYNASHDTHSGIAKEKGQEWPNEENNKRNKRTF